MSQSLKICVVLFSLSDVSLSNVTYKCILHNALTTMFSVSNFVKNKLQLVTLTIMWKFENLSITQILRINFRDSTSAKSAILTHSEALNLDFHQLLHFLKAEIDQINKIQSPKNGKNASFELLKPLKLISRKI